MNWAGPPDSSDDDETTDAADNLLDGAVAEVAGVPFPRHLTSWMDWMDLKEPFVFQLIRTTILTKHSREVRPDDDLSAEKIHEDDDGGDAGGAVEMELLNCENGTANKSEETKINDSHSHSFLERLRGKKTKASSESGLPDSGIRFFSQISPTLIQFLVYKIPTPTHQTALICKFH